MMTTSGGGGSSGTLPEPYPNLQFPVAQAEELINAARQTIQVVRSAASSRRRQVSSLKSSARWTGTAADQFFGSDAPKIESDASSIIGQLQALIHTVQGGIQTFQDEQAANQAVARANASNNQKSPPAPSRPTGVASRL